MAVLSISLLLAVAFVGAHKRSVLFVLLLTIYLGIVTAYRRKSAEGEVFLSGSGTLRNIPLWTLGIVAGGMVFLVDRFMAAGAAKALAVVMLAACWLAPALLVSKDLGVLQALRLSAMGSLRNPLAFLTMLVLGAVLLFVASIPLGLGLVVTMPVLACAAVKASEDIFG